MTITMGTLSTGYALHGSLKAGAWERSESVQTFFAVIGEYRMQGALHGRDLSTWCEPSGYANRALLQAAIDAVNSYQGDSGTVICTIDSVSTTFANCVFQGFELEEEPWYDASGVNGWIVRGSLRWRQIKQ